MIHYDTVRMILFIFFRETVTPLSTARYKLHILMAKQQYTVLTARYLVYITVFLHWF